MIEKFDSFIGVFAEGRIADCTVHARGEVAIAEKIMLDHPFDISALDVDAETVCSG